ncbi:MAG: outer membrane protein assembly factor BamE [Proteobacteria bacterium]|nr:outer membrane protein assembly factor BamE [Pseudomonadota bacterium]
MFCKSFLMMRAKLIMITVITMMLVACGGISVPKLPSLSAYKMEINQGNMITSEMRRKLKVGMTKPQVQAVIGTPLINDAFHSDHWDFVYRLEKDGKLIERQRITLYFENERLARIDDSNMPVLPAVIAPIKVE